MKLFTNQSELIDFPRGCFPETKRRNKMFFIKVIWKTSEGPHFTIQQSQNRGCLTSFVFSTGFLCRHRTKISQLNFTASLSFSLARLWISGSSSAKSSKAILCISVTLILLARFISIELVRAALSDKKHNKITQKLASLIDRWILPN